MSALAKPKTGLINEVFHAALLRDVDAVVRSANIPPEMLYRSMVGLCSEAEIDYVKELRRQASRGIYGLVLHGPKPSSSPLERFSALAAACLRNYIAARVMTLQDVLEALSEGDMPSPTVLCIPNFLSGLKDGGKVASWDVPELLGLLYSRQSAGLQTVVYVQELDLLGKAYGAGCDQHLRSEHFVKADATKSVKND